MPSPKSGVPLLPKKSVASIVQQHVDREQRLQEVKFGRWLLVYYYLQGYRRFKAVDGDGTVLHASDLSSKKNGKAKERRLAFKIGTFLKQVNDTAGAINSMDLSPHIDPGDLSLAARREAAGAQVMADYAIKQENLSKNLFSHFLATYGLAGVTPHIYNDPTNGLISSYEAVHPRELMPFPSLGWNLADLRGVVRRRAIPLDQLKVVYPRKVPSNMNLLDTFRQTIGEPPDPQHASTESEVLTGEIQSLTNGTSIGKSNDAYQGVYVNETRIMGPNNTLDRLIVSSGDHVFYDEEFEGQPFDLGVARFYETGSFYGAGLYDSIFSIVREIENLVEDFVENVKNADKYPLFIIPDGQIKNRAWDHDNGRTLKYMTLKSDISMMSGEKQLTPVVINPVDSGGAPGQAADALASLLQRTSPLTDIVREKGRIDGAPGLEILQEEEQRSLQTPLQNTVEAYETCHRASISRLSQEVMLTDTPIPVNRLSLDLAGVIVNQEDSTVSFQSNPLPNVNRLKIRARQNKIVSKALMKREAFETFPLHNDMNRLLIHSFDNGIEIPWDTRQERASYEKVVIDILSLYGDGLRPGSIIWNREAAFPPLQLYVLSSFMQSPAYSLASADVRTKMLEYKDLLVRSSGGVLPPGVPDMLSVNNLEGVTP